MGKINGFADFLNRVLKEGSEPRYGLDEFIDSGAEAVLRNPTKGKRIVKVFIDYDRRNILIQDNGIGMTARFMKDAYSNVDFNCWGLDILYGLKGNGRFVGIAILCGDSGLSGTYFEQMSSIGDNILSKFVYHITRDNNQLENPDDIQEDENNIDNIKFQGIELDDFNIINGRLMGTNTLIRNGNPINKTVSQLLFEYGAMFYNELESNEMEIFINNERVLPIDITHDGNIWPCINGLPEKGIIVTTPPNYRFATIYERVYFHHKDDIIDKDGKYKNERFIDAKSTIPIGGTIKNLPSDSKPISETFPWEGKTFNTLGGVFPRLNGRLLSFGGNPNVWFSQKISEDKERRTTKTKGKYGDVSGGISSYGRFSINLRTREDYLLFKGGSVKSKGIMPFALNEELFTDWFVDKENRVSLYDYFCRMRYFTNEIIYRWFVVEYVTSHSNGEVTQETFDKGAEMIQNIYENFDFLSQSKKGRIKGVKLNKNKVLEANEKTDEKIFEVNETNSFVSFRYKSDKKTKKRIILDESLQVNFLNAYARKYVEGKENGEKILKGIFGRLIEVVFNAKPRFNHEELVRLIISQSNIIRDNLS